MRVHLPRSIRFKAVQIALAAAIVVFAFVGVVPRIADYGQVFEHVTEIETAWIFVVFCFAVLNIGTPAVVHRAALPGLRFGAAVSTDWASTATTNTLPGGSAIAFGVSWSMYRSFGLQRSSISTMFLVSGLADNLVKFATPALALAWLASERPVGDNFQQAAILGAVLLSVVVVATAAVFSDSVGSRLGRLLGRITLFGGGLDSKLERLLETTRQLLRQRWRQILGAVALDQMATFGLFLACLWAVEGSVNQISAAASINAANSISAAESTSVAAALAAFAFGRLASALPITPGGAGLVELGLVGALLTVSTTDKASLVAAVLLFRFCSYLLPTVLGLATWLHWRLTRTPSSEKAATSG